VTPRRAWRWSGAVCLAAVLLELAGSGRPVRMAVLALAAASLAVVVLAVVVLRAAVRRLRA
jgi:hypothetical protein